MKFISEKAWRRAERTVAKFQKDEDGATAIEFAFVALPFFALLFGIIELALVFFISSALSHATSEAGRSIRVGNFQACGGEDEFKALVCSEMKGLGNCWKNVRIDVVDGASFKTITLPEPPAPAPRDPDKTGDDAIPQTPNGTVSSEANTAGTALVVRSILYHRLVLPPKITRLESPGTPGIRVITSTTAFKNEPFPASGTCDSDTNDKISEGKPA
ncbi:TadE/TadG family type IV pilus assembly protein [Litorimonas sp. WD9-15]|uniref:TadE/TadG family type IV pilus assembly protein n=1 Tax=Litorimonas sp. WD9-15 TaxID=3418716 RepID=UPI003D04755E